MTRLCILCLICLLFGGLLPAQVGQSFSDFKKKDLFTTFLLKLQQRRTLGRQLELHYQAAAFPKKIRIRFTLDGARRLLRAQLAISRRLVISQGKVNVLARDLVREFLRATLPPAVAAELKPQVQALLAADPGSSSGDSPLRDVFMGITQGYTRVFPKAHLSMQNRDRSTDTDLVLRVAARNLGPPGPKSSGPISRLFLPQTLLAKYKLRRVMARGNFQVWLNSNHKALIQRVVDVRWLFKTAAAAQVFYKKNIKRISEGAREIQSHGINGVAGDLRVFHKGPDSRLLKSLKLRLNMYFFVFSVDRALAKVFVVGAERLTLQQAAPLARAAASHIQKNLAK